MSQYLDTLEVGKDTVDIKGPVGRVNYKGCGQFLLGRKELPKKNNIGMMAVRVSWPVSVCKNKDSHEASLPFR